MSRQVNSRVRSVVIKEKLKYQPIIASDRLLGDYKVRNTSIADRGVVVLTSKNEQASLEEVIVILKDYVQNRKSTLPPAVVLSASNNDISRNGYIKNHPVKEGREEKVRKDMIEYIMANLKSLDEYLKLMGGVLIVAPVLPRPADQCYENCVHITRRLQKFHSEVYVELNERIATFNESNGVQTPPINTYVEKSKTTQRSTGQRKINKQLFEEDLIHPLQAKQLKMIYSLERAIKAKSISH